MEMRGFGNEDVFMPTRTVHWSFTKDHQNLSVLVAGEAADTGKFIAAIYFRQTAPARRETVSKKFSYLRGPGVKIGWKPEAGKSLKVDFCSSSSSAAAQDAIQHWQGALKNRLPIEFSVKKKFAPFSDLNQHCIYIVRSLLGDQRPQLANYGAALPVINEAQGKIVDADIFIYVSEFEKLKRLFKDRGYPAHTGEAYAAKMWNYTLTHELGHFLGLGHQFDGTQSIMSYKNEGSTLHAYDVQAIQELYPLKKKSR
jgi:hypothetical protein